jgi:phosphatidylglycerol:prolipoprotein diacylglycerol transferase
MPVLCQIGSFPIYSYGVLSAAAVGLAAFLGWRRAKSFGFDASRAVDAVFLLFIAGMAGARLMFAIQHPSLYAGEPWRVLDLREGGLVWYGGFLAAFAAAFAVTGAFRWKRWAFADFIAPLAAAGHAVGRIGCYLNGCCSGINGHPVQLYEAGLLALLAGFLWSRTGRSRREGDLFLLYVLIYAAGRFALEFLRADQTRYASLSIPQFTSVVLFALAAFTWKLRHGSRKI